ncbi:MAG: HAMP domain-containing protein [Nitrospirae bacterium]|nr:HAMP domain-containing protein [Nitrospirota bacterium]
MSIITLYVYIAILLMSTTLLAIFTVTISKSFARPVTSIIKQIRALSEGRVDITKKIEVNSKDEIGILSNDFNYLMEEIHDLSTFKKIIEEDDNLEDVYYRLGTVFMYPRQTSRIFASNSGPT